MGRLSHAIRNGRRFGGSVSVSAISWVSVYSVTATILSSRMVITPAVAVRVGRVGGGNAVVARLNDHEIILGDEPVCADPVRSGELGGQGQQKVPQHCRLTLVGARPGGCDR